MDRGRGSSSYLCEHCGEKVSKTVYYQHKKLYYDKTTETWMRQETSSVATDDTVFVNDFCFSDDDMQTSGEY
jgi:hypothetical protein